ncbi:methylated-DNA--protein-cysteine methyltransferase [mine drainage metagenome]|uniref:methylated-DNA--[protein]-cysteine S-methyltransferase n=1 Tax=mine drainage metagenome TaxID=410659 RepID=T0ZJS7_9ZZZZ
MERIYVNTGAEVRTIGELKFRMDAMGMTEFQKRVLLAVRSIKRGSTATYKQVAKAAGYPKAYRAVGTVLRGNPFPPFVPCHRVIRSDGSIGNYSGKGGIRAKRKLLISEGAL